MKRLVEYNRKSMNRRNTLKNLIAAAGGLVVLPAWADGWRVESLPARIAGVFDTTDLQRLAAVADTIIPKGDAIGALSVGTDKYLAALLENCYDADVRDNVKHQMKELDAKAESAHRHAFILCDQAQREALLLAFDSSQDKKAKDFFNLMKTETIRGFNTSKEVMLGYLKYKVVPGHYYGCVDAI